MLWWGRGRRDWCVYERKWRIDWCVCVWESEGERCVCMREREKMKETGVCAIVCIHTLILSFHYGFYISQSNGIRLEANK